MTAHVVAVADTPRPVIVMECLHCGARVSILLPVALSELTNLALDFDERHCTCEREETEA